MQKEKKVKLLIITQKVDENDDVLGFFHRWIEECAKHCEQVTVIALGVGEYHLPDNVHVFSLGKEEGVSRLGYILNFYHLIWRERKNYDTVFVHMNQEYILLGWKIWKLLRKKIFLWRNHPYGNVFTRFAILVSNGVFCTSWQSYTAKFKKTKIMPAGIDTEIFKRDESISRIPNSILFLGRIAPVKNVEVFVDALNILDKSGVTFTASIYGDATDKDREYYREIKTHAANLEKKGKITFHGAVPNTQTPAIYNRHEIYVNATPSGSFDKTILEAMACECVVVVSNESLRGVVPDNLLFKESDANSLAVIFKNNLSVNRDTKTKIAKDMREYVKQHDISILVRKLSNDVK